MVMLLSVPAAGLLATAAATDIAWRTIPNRLVLALLVLAAIRIGLDLATAPGLDTFSTAGSDLGVAFLVFGLGLVAFQFNVMGGGDVKLIAAVALWLGAGAVLDFLMLTAIAGGGLALVYLVRARSWSVNERQSLPYGVAIAAGGLGVMLLGG
jgi:prepilin peptidase CpaA